MKIKPLILLLCLFDVQNTGAKQPKAKNEGAIHASSVKSDTLSFAKKDTLNVFIPNKPQETKVVFIKENIKGNLFKDILPIITLFLGIGINKLLDCLKDRKRITKAGSRWVAEIRGLEAPIKQQIESILELLNEDQQDMYKHPQLVVMSTLNAENFKSLDKSELLEYIERRQKRNYPKAIMISNQTHGFINIVSHLHDSLQEKFKEYLSGTSNHIGTVNENLQQLTQAFAHYGAELEMQYGDPLSYKPYAAMLQLFNDLIEPHRKDGRYDLFQLQTAFFYELIKILAQERHDERTRKMADYTTACLNAIKGLRMEKYYWRENLTTISERYSEQLPGLREVADLIENRGK